MVTSVVTDEIRTTRHNAVVTSVVTDDIRTKIHNVQQ